MSLSVAELLQTKPVAGNGIPIGVGDWRFAVERINGAILGTDPPFIVGAFKVGASPLGDDPKVGALAWEDLTSRWRGCTIQRGADEPFGRPRVGECQLTLDNRDDYLSPTVNYADTRPGVVIRVSLTSETDTRADGWLPVFTGLVDSWVGRQTGARPGDHTYADQFADVILVESLAALARVDDNAATSQGSNETFTPRVRRLLNAARWRYGNLRRTFTGPTDRGITLQATDMARPRVEELYLTADSSSMVIRSDVTGAACLTDLVTALNAYPSRLGDFSDAGTLTSGEPWPFLGFRPHTEDLDADLKRLLYDAGSLVIANDPEHLVNDTRYARVGGTQQAGENALSIGRYGRSTRARNDLISTADLYALGVARDDNDRLARTTFRIDELRVTATGKDDLYLLCLAALDLGDSARITLKLTAEAPPSGVFADCRTRTIRHEITPLRPGSLAWTSTIAFDTADLTGFPAGSILPGFSV